MSAPPAPNLDHAAQFLELLDPDAERFTFQTFDDSPAKSKSLAKVYNGTLDELSKPLATLQAAGAGVFVTTNETDGTGRSTENITRVRAVFVDLDGAPLDPVLTCGLEPHVIVESSPGKYHAYWTVDGLPLDHFEGVQRAIATRFNGDPKVSDLPRVMRLPGFAHQKGEPFMTRVHGVWPRTPYKAEQILTEFPPGKPKASANGQLAADQGAESTADLVKQITTGESYHAPLCALAWRYVSDGMAPGKVVETLRGFMDASTGPRDDRWRSRYNEIPRTVSTAEDKLSAGVPHPAQRLLDRIAGQSQPAKTAGGPPFVPRRISLPALRRKGR